MIRIVTDTGSDITHVEASKMGIELMELGVTFDEFPYDHHNDLTFSVFYENLAKAKELPRTSQVNPSQFLEVFNDAKEKGEEVVVIALSGGLSGTFSSAQIAKEECDYKGISLIDTRQATISQRMLVDHALKLREQGKDRKEIEESLIKQTKLTGFACCLDTLTYLKKGGRVPPAMALIGNALKIKPVITLKDGKAEPVDKVRGFQAGVRTMLSMIENNNIDPSHPVYIGHTNNEERGKTLAQEIKSKFQVKECHLYPVGCVIGTHAGPDAVAVGYFKY